MVLEQDETAARLKAKVGVVPEVVVFEGEDA
jgi:hypothetical protein